MSHPVTWVQLVDNVAQDLCPSVGCAVGPRLMTLPVLLKHGGVEPRPLLFLMNPFITQGVPKLKPTRIGCVCGGGGVDSFLPC